jgi:Rnl2 family RNA ligase
MKFKSYTEIENSYRTKTIDLIVEMGLSANTVEWCVTEKAHGSQYSIFYDGIDLRPAKRSCLIAEDDNFNGSLKVFADNKDKIVAIYKELNLTSGEDVLAVCGEIIGGSYPHPEVTKSTNATRVQKGIFYSPENLFYAFDIMVNERYLNYDEAVKLFTKHNIFYAKILKRGTLTECLQFPNEYKSYLPSWLGLPEIEGDNVCEGNVIKLIESKHFSTGSRVILKNKNDKWKEKSSESKNPKLPKEEIIVSPEAEILINELESYVCENRLHNVLSKIGVVTQKDFGKILGSLSVDALKDFRKDFEDQINLLSEEEQKILNKRVNLISQGLVRSHFVDILDGKF